MARFFSPGSVAVDSAGNVYVADTGNHAIRKVTPAGTVTTLAGSPGVRGSDNGTDSEARFYRPSGVAVDSEGNVYVSERHEHTIRKVMPAGVATTLAGSAGATGSIDGMGSDARFSYPCGVAADSMGNIRVADTGNDTIRKVTPAGLAGASGSADGTGSTARFDAAIGVAIDSKGTLYVADNGSQTVRRLTTEGVVTTVGGVPGLRTTADGYGSDARFNCPYGIAVDADGNLYVTNNEAHCISVGRPAYLAPTITSQPTSQAISEGGSASFTVAATGTGALTYQWQKDGVDLAEGGHYSGVTTATLTVSGASIGNGGQYRCIVRRVNTPTTSDAATLTVIPDTGTLTIDTAPVKGEVFVDGTSWGTAPQSRTVNVGSYTVAFGQVAGHTSPAAQAATVAKGQATMVSGTYVRMYTLQVTCLPAQDPVTSLHEAGASVSIQAPVPPEGFVFDHWSGDIGQADSHANPISILMDQDRAIVANYAAVDNQASGDDGGRKGCGQGVGPFNVIGFYGLCWLGLFGLRLCRGRPPRR